MIKNSIIGILFCFLGIFRLYAANIIVKADNISAHSQTSKTMASLPISISSDIDITSLQLDLYLPEGFTCKSITKGDVANNSHVVTSSIKEDYTRIILYSNPNQVFKARSGVALNITLEVDTALASKDYNVLLKNVYVSDASKPANRFSVSDQNITISITTLAEKIYFPTPFTILRMDEKSFISPIVLPYFTTDKRLEFKSSDNSIVQMNGNEAISVKQGRSTVTVETLDGSNLSASHPVYSECSMLYIDNHTVCSQSYDTDIRIPVTINAFNSISHFQFDLHLPDGFSLTSVDKSSVISKHSVLIEPKDCFTRVLCYTSDNASISRNECDVIYLNIHVDKLLEAKNYDAWLRNTKLSPTSQSPELYEIPDWNSKFDVTTLIESIKLNKHTLELYDGHSEQLNVLISPDFAVKKSVNWKSLDESLALVDTQGTVQVRGDGITNIIVSTNDGSNLHDTCTVVVKPILTSQIILSDEAITISHHSTHQLSGTILPSDATYSNIKWSSDDYSVASIDENGIVSAVNVGKTIIRAKATDGSMVESACEVTVIPLLIQNISLSNDTINIGKECDAKLVATISPENATDKSLTWESTNEAVATVNEYGVVRTKQLGSTKIIVTSVTNPSVQGECTIVVHGIESMLTAVRDSENTLQLEWKSLYNKYDIADYNVYVSEDSKPFILWMPNTSATSATFKIREGVSYRFLVTARDKAGNMEKYDENKCVTIK